MSEIDLIVYLKASISIGYKDHMLSIIKRIEKLQNNGCWVDLATTATATTVILDVLDTLKTDSSIYSQIKTSLETLLFKSIIFLQNSLRQQQLEKMKAEYPWDNKASTSLKCIQAWLKFEDIIDIPIYEAIDSLKSYSETERYKSSDKTALVVLEELKNEKQRAIKKNIDLASEIDELSKQTDRRKIAIKQNMFLWPYFFISLYIISTIVVFLLRYEWPSSILNLLMGAFVNVWLFHLTFLAVILGFLSVFRKELSRTFLGGHK